MNVIIERSPLHTTSDGRIGQYVTLLAADTGRSVGRFHAFLNGDGGEHYESFYGSPYPKGTSFADAAVIAYRAHTRWKQIPYAVRVRFLRAMATDEPRKRYRRVVTPRCRHILKRGAR